MERDSALADSTLSRMEPTVSENQPNTQLSRQWGLLLRLLQRFLGELRDTQPRHGLVS